jgi:cytochrome c-type biogenesis protein CcmE
MGRAAGAPGTPSLKVIAVTTQFHTATTGPDDDIRPPRRRATPLILALGLLTLVAFGYLAANAFADSVVYYRTPTEVMSLTGQQVRLSGSVVPGSITASDGRGTSFAVTDGATTVTVTYAGAAPPALRDGGDIVAEGTLDASRLFHATSLITKCPSKFSDERGRG